LAVKVVADRGDVPALGLAQNIAGAANLEAASRLYQRLGFVVRDTNVYCYNIESV